jgi:hypothetical protein
MKKNEQPFSNCDLCDKPIEFGKNFFSIDYIKGKAELTPTEEYDSTVDVVDSHELLIFCSSCGKNLKPIELRTTILDQAVKPLVAELKNRKPIRVSKKVLPDDDCPF